MRNQGEILYVARNVQPHSTRNADKHAAFVQIKLEFESVGFCEGRKTGEAGENASEQGENQQQTQPTWDAENGNRTGVTEVGLGRALIHCATRAPPTNIPFPSLCSSRGCWFCSERVYPLYYQKNSYDKEGTSSKISSWFYIRFTSNSQDQNVTPADTVFIWLSSIIISTTNNSK